MSLYTVVSRGVAGRLGPRPIDRSPTVDPIGPRNPPARHPGVRLPGASMRVLEAGLALGAIATAILIGGVGR